jgi:PAS domain S-box-containing protein
MPIQTLLRKPTSLEDFEIILELLDEPALIWNKNQDTIEACNANFILFSGYSRNDISTLKFSDLFPEVKYDESNHDLKSTNIHLGNNRNQDVGIKVAQLLAENKFRIVTLQKKIQEENDSNITYHSDNWEAINNLLVAPLATTLQTAMQSSLSAGQKLTECDHLAVYLPIPGSENKLILLDGLGEYDYLPKIVHVDEISHLRIPVVWQLGSHTTSVLHQSALTAHQRYLATCPLDPTSPMDGLLVAGNMLAPPPPHLSSMMAIISRTITVSINIHKVVTGTKRELQETNYQLEIVRNIRNQIAEGIIFIDTDYTIIDLNTSSSQILGYTESEMLNQPLEKVLVCDRGITEILKETSENKKLVHELGELEIKRRDGQTIPVLIRVIPLISDSGPNAQAILFSDLSTLKRYEDRSRQLETQANIGEMIAVFAHEVRNPINNIRMGVENFSSYFENDPEAEEEIDRILTDVDRLSDLMKSILTAYRTKEYQMEPINLPGFIESIIFRWKPRMSRYNVKPSIEIADIDGDIFGDKRSLEQVFTNIIQNAIDAMKKTGGKLVIRASEEVGNNAIRVDIADTGPGIPAEIQGKIFNLYYTTRQNGNGIGLAITKQIVDAHNGQISVTSVPGGTVFRIILPKEK